MSTTVGRNKQEAAGWRKLNIRSERTRWRVQLLRANDDHVTRKAPPGIRLGLEGEDVDLVEPRIQVGPRIRTRGSMKNRPSTGTTGTELTLIKYGSPHPFQSCSFRAETTRSQVSNPAHVQEAVGNSSYAL